MPFDGTKFTPEPMTRLRKLEILLEIARKATGEQHRYCSCLFHDVIADGRLAAAGMPYTVKYNGGIPAPSPKTHDWFGGYSAIFSGLPIAEKRQFLREEIARERALTREPLRA